MAARTLGNDQSQTILQHTAIGQASQWVKKGQVVYFFLILRPAQFSALAVIDPQGRHLGSIEAGSYLDNALLKRLASAGLGRKVEEEAPVLDALRSHEGVGQDAEAAPALLMSRFGFGQSRARALLDWMRAQAWLN